MKKVHYHRQDTETDKLNKLRRSINELVDLANDIVSFYPLADFFSGTSWDSIVEKYRNKEED